MLLKSRELGFLTGDESREMNEAHVSAALQVGRPFSADAAEVIVDAEENDGAENGAEEMMLRRPCPSMISGKRGG